MSTLMQVRSLGVAAAGLVAVLWIAPVVAADSPRAPSGARAGDDALTCDQIYAEGMAESQRSQQERARTVESMRAQSAATGALLTGAMATGGLGGTGMAAQAAAESQADRQMAMLSPPPPNPRMERLKNLWAAKHCVKH